MSTAMNDTIATPVVWALDPDHTIVEFTAKHMMMTTVRGRFHEITGTILFDESDPESSSVDVQIAGSSIDTGVDQRNAHLRSEDFLDVEKHPYLRFRSRRIVGSLRAPGDAFQLVGDLTIRGVTREVTLDATYEGEGVDPWGGRRKSFSAATRIDRRDFGLLWNRALETGGVLVSNEIRISLHVQLIQS